MALLHYCNKGAIQEDILTALAFKNNAAYFADKKTK